LRCGSAVSGAGADDQVEGLDDVPEHEDASFSHRRAKKRNSRVPVRALAATADRVRGFDFSFF
jgi:hypothetical protein